MSVVVPTYRRADSLRHCLTSLCKQHLVPAQVVVVCRPEDCDSRNILASFSGFEEVLVEEPGLTAALRAGVAHCWGDLIAITDDDARPPPEWLAALATHYADSDVGAVGGRDRIHMGQAMTKAHKTVVGKVGRTGRMTGNHDAGIGVARDVHFLKGVNSSYRRDLLAIPSSLRGGGIVGADLASSLTVRQRGFRVIYDPNIIVDHYPGRRYGGDSRTPVGGIRPVDAVLDQVYNETYILASLFPRFRFRRLMYVILVGDRASVGILRSLWGRLQGDADIRGLCRVTRTVLFDAFHDAKESPLAMEPVPRLVERHPPTRAASA